MPARNQHWSKDLGDQYRQLLDEFSNDFASEIYGAVDDEHKQLTGPTEDAYIRAAWANPQKRQQLLQQLAPARPDGTPEPVGAVAFWHKVLRAHGWDNAQISQYLRTLSDPVAAAQAAAQPNQPPLTPNPPPVQPLGQPPAQPQLPAPVAPASPVAPMPPQQGGT